MSDSTSGLPPALDPRGRPRARGARAHAASGVAAARPRRGLVSGSLLGVRIVAAVLSFAIVLGSGWAWATYQKFTGNVATGQNLPTTSPGGKDVDGQDQNILLVGNDSRAGATPDELHALSTQNDGGSTNTDTMILLHIPANGSKATLISFPRDSYVDIPGYGSGRINSAYADAYNAAKTAGSDERGAESAGILLTAATISQLTGLTIDHYLQVSLLGFYRISNAIGGVEVCLNQRMGPATKYGQTGDGYDSGFEGNNFVYSYSGINLPAGITPDLQGTQALAFVRQRHGLPGSDLDRVTRQRYFLGAVFRKLSSSDTLLNPFSLNKLVGAVSSSLLADPKLNLLTLATQARDLQSGNIVGATMVTTGNETIDGADVLGVDPAAVKAQMLALVGVKADDAYTTATAAAPATVQVQVLNGSGANGVAAANAARLTTAGFQVTGTGDANSTPVTTIAYPDGMQAQAKALAAVVPGATVTLSTAVTGVTLTLGADGVGVSDGSTPAASASTTPSGAAAPAVADAQGGLACIN